MTGVNNNFYQTDISNLGAHKGWDVLDNEKVNKDLLQECLDPAKYGSLLEDVDAIVKSLHENYLRSVGEIRTADKWGTTHERVREAMEKTFKRPASNPNNNNNNAQTAPKDGSGAAANTVTREYFDEQMQLLELRFRQQQNLNVWKETIDSGSTRHRGQFANKAKKFYGREFNKTAYCMLTSLPGAVVGHLWPHAKIDDPRVKSLNIVRDNLEGPRNAIVVLKSIEEAFDRGRLCLVWHAFNKQFIVVILDPSLKNEFVADGLQFAAIEGSYLRHPAGKIPFLRVLGVHASESYSEALVNGWITQEEFDAFKDFRTLSPIEKQTVVVHQPLTERYPVFGNEYAINIRDEVVVLAAEQSEHKGKVVKYFPPTRYLIEYNPGDRLKVDVKHISKLPLLANEHMHS